MHYAEVPIPTSMKQGAFSICLSSSGVSQVSSNLLRLKIKIGRIGAFSLFPHANTYA